MSDYSSNGPFVGARIERSIKEDSRLPFVEGVVVGYLDADKSDFVYPANPDLAAYGPGLES
jgi:hypothetical protein